ncbi:TonB dependent receptor [compost metagenome]
MTGLLRLDYQHAGAGAFTVRNYTPPAITERPARDLVNLRVGASIGDLEIALFANNLFDEDAPNIVGPFGTITENVEQRPRVVGLSLNTRF